MSTENEMTIKVIVELQAKPDKRTGLKNLLESVEAKFVSSQPGFLGSTYDKWRQDNHKKLDRSN